MHKTEAEKGVVAEVVAQLAIRIADVQTEAGYLSHDERARFTEDFIQTLDSEDIQLNANQQERMWRLSEVQFKLRAFNGPEAADLVQDVCRHIKTRDAARLTQMATSNKVVPENSIQNDYLVCLEDGKKLRMLKRHLRTKYAMTPDQYRKKWGLPEDYPMVAPALREQAIKGLVNLRGMNKKLS